MQLPVHVIVEHCYGAVTFIRHRDLARYTKRHGPVTVSRPSERTIANHHGIEVPVVAVPDAEEIAQGYVHARRLLAVVVHAQASQSGPRELVVGSSCEPKMCLTTPGPRRSAITKVSPGMMRLLSSLLPTNGFPLETRWAEKVFMRGRSRRLKGSRSGTWADTLPVSKTRNKNGLIEPELYKPAEAQTSGPARGYS